MMCKRFLAIFLVFVMLCLGACGNKAAVETTAVETTAIVETMVAAEEVTEAVSAYPMTLVDQAGREVTIEKEPERIVSGYYISTSAFLALGLKDKLIGIEAKAAKRNIYKLSAPELMDLPNVGSAKEFDLEGCIALQPDLVMLPLKLKDAAATMEGLGIPVLLVNPESAEESAGMIELIAKATGREEKAAELTAYLDGVKKRLEDLTGDSPRVYMAGNSDLLSTAGANMYQTEMIREAGCINVAEELSDKSWAAVSYEQIVSWNPDVILIAAEASYTVDDVLRDPALTEVDAVKNGKVYVMPSDIEAWDAPVPGAVLGSLFLSMNVKENLSEEEYQKTVTEFYEKFYGFTWKAE